MIERRDEELSKIYRDAEEPRPPQRVDDNILAASQRVAGNLRRPATFGFSRRWGTPVAVAATVLVTSTVALMVYELQSGSDAVAPQVPRGGRTAKVSPVEPRADQPRTPPPVVLQPIAPAPPISQALQSERAEQRPGESAASTASAGARQPAFAPEAPRASDVLSKREEVKPAPATAPPAAASERARATQQAPAPDALPASDVQQPIRPAQAPAAAPGASRLRETGLPLQGAGAVTSRLAAPEANERTPEKWLADIRKLKTEGKATDAERELAEFKKRYPDYILPEDLR
ncbi:MAG: hypothetical protein E6H49_03560 [Betaproteobacteria bacterium]|nr:MAG: hypothetical protein E6H49_03560 [Betaproteobacteria bacterium]